MNSVSIAPDLFTSLPPLYDPLPTETSEKQYETIHECLPFLSCQESGLLYNENGVQNLDRDRHISFLHKSLKRLPAQYVVADASRPWIFYWALNGLAMMGEDVSQYRESLISTIRPIQNSTGGFGGGNGQMSHLAPTYAIILALCIVGGHEGLEVIDRKAMWKWLCSLKQPDGGFQMAIGGEEDVRGAYCAMVIIALLNLPIELSQESSNEGHTLLTGLPEWVARCQTFEGGISARPDAEAHGAYAFCALACLCILDEPHISIPQYLNVPCLISWLSARQYAPEGGLSGRTNKLVDGCYSHWVGGCWPLIEASLGGRFIVKAEPSGALTESLLSREGLIRYILCCCQDQTKRGGLRDKPSHRSDAYHSCYVLAGLSSLQRRWHFNKTPKEEDLIGLLSAPFQWASEPRTIDEQVYSETDCVNSVHPVFVIPEGTAERTRNYFASKTSF
ncbi:Protein farnesyltransferase subunit beta [Podosphaera aphanis]|nr:Protein farnesyltransferase subunit beta [Podosphaera aphanis]